MAFKSKYRGDQIEALLDRVNSGESGGTVLSNTFLVIGDYNSDARNNFAGVANGNKSADYYVGVVNVGGTKLQGIATIYSSEEGTSFSFIGYPSAGEYAHQMVKITCTYNGSNFNTVLDPIMDYKQDVIEDLDSIRYGANLGATALQSIPSEYVTKTELASKNYLTSIPAEYVTDSELLAKEYATVSQLDSKVNVSDLSAVATSGNYNDLLNKPTIPDVSNKVDKVSGKGLSTEDFTTALKSKLEALSNYDDTTLSNSLSILRNDFDTLVSGDSTTAIKTFNEIIAFLDGIADTDDLESIIASIEQQIAGKMDKVTLAAIATSGDYNDLNNKPTVQKALIIGDSSDEVKANFAALVNGTVSADYYIGSIAFEGNILQGVVSPYIAPAVSGGNGYFVIAEFPYNGGNSSQLIKAKCSCTKDGIVSTTIEKPLDNKQNIISDLTTIREGAAKGSTSVQHNDIEDVARKDNGYVIANGILDEADKYWHMPDSSLNDKEHTLASKSDIPSAITESTVSGWGFTKNTGTITEIKMNGVSKGTSGVINLGDVPTKDVVDGLIDWQEGTDVDISYLYNNKQDSITDLVSIRDGAAKGATALQSYTEQYKGTITEVKANGTSIATSGVANIPAASTSAYGVTKLTSSTSSTSTTLAATASAVKSAYDLANSYKGTVTAVKINNVSKSPSSGTVDLGYVAKQLNTSTSSSMSLKPNLYYRNTSTSLSSLTITLASETNTSIINEYFVEFTTSSSGTTVSLPSTIKWANGETPTFEASTTYQISIVNNFGIVTKFK